MIAGKLAGALEVEQDLVDVTLIATRQQQNDEARSEMLDRERAYWAAFRPHLQILTEHRVPRQVFIAALLTTARLLRVEVAAGTWEACTDDRGRVAKRVIGDHHSEHGDVPAFGAGFEGSYSSDPRCPQSASGGSADQIGNPADGRGYNRQRREWHMGSREGSGTRPR